MAEIGTIDRFSSSPKKLMSYAGLVPSTYASGEKTRHGHITKQGSRWLRWTMIEVAQLQLLCKRKPGFGWYYRKINQRKCSSVAAVATARKLLAVIWRMLKDNRPFQAVPPQREVQVAHLPPIVAHPRWKGALSNCETWCFPQLCVCANGTDR
ncbi:MAG: IS110 family transposase [Deltaproteobacteria bacterium]|nr:IS110 family transposase [Deltaproteobacteria bacterium]